jgi:DNA-binding MarR family transcriptional regulator
MSKEIEFHFSGPNDSPGYLLGQVTMLWQRRIKWALDPLDLTQTQFVLLAALGWLSKKNPSVTQIDIANQSNSDRMMVSKVLRTLEEKGFITRAEHDTDTRAKAVRLTSSGAVVLQDALRKVEAADLEFFAALDAKLPAFNKSLVRLIEAHR